MLLLAVIAVAVVGYLDRIVVVVGYSDRIVPKFSLMEKVIWEDFQGNMPKKYGMK